FFQAEDGIRDWSVTGVQTCALPICDERDRQEIAAEARLDTRRVDRALAPQTRLADRREVALGQRAALVDEAGQRRRHDALARFRSEERRVGKESMSRTWAEQSIRRK